MKQTPAILIFTLFSLFSYSQSRIGFSKTEIKSEFSHYDYTSGITDDGTEYLQIKAVQSYNIYYFNDYGFCYAVAIFPRTQGDLNSFVQDYNSKYVIVSDSEWKAYVNKGGILSIKLFYDEDIQASFFIYNLLE